MGTKLAHGVDRFRTVILLGMPLLLLSSGFVWGVEIDNFGCVNMQKLFQNYYKTVRYKKELGERGKELKAEGEEIKTEVRDLEKKQKQLRERMRNPGLSKSARADVQKKLKAKAKLYDKKRKEFQSFMSGKVQNLKEEYMKKRTEIVKEIRSVIRAYADEQDIDIVLDSSGMTSNLIPTVLHYPEEADMTETVLQKLNKGHEDEVPEDADVEMPLDGDISPQPGRTP